MVVEGEGKGWVFNRTFSSKWKAELALDVFKKGGRVSDYWREARKRRPSQRKAWRVLQKMESALEEIRRLNPTCEEIEEYAKLKENVYGVVTYTQSEDYFGPFIHDKWSHGFGRVHIDIGCCGYHLMLDKYTVDDFIEYIKRRREG